MDHLATERGTRGIDAFIALTNVVIIIRGLVRPWRRAPRTRG
jgi:hypothetical protein